MAKRVRMGHQVSNALRPAIVSIKTSIFIVPSGYHLKTNPLPKAASTDGHRTVSSFQKKQQERGVECFKRSCKSSPPLPDLFSA